MSGEDPAPAREPLASPGSVIVSNDQDLYAAVLAGGKGERFWPVSLRSYPKQFLSVFGDRPMLAETLHRIEGFIPPEKTLIMTGGHLRELVLETVGQVPPENVLGEPVSKNTAPAIGLAALLLDVKAPGAVMAALPADHLIKDNESFRRDLSLAVQVARVEGRLVTFGIRPNRPETGYGYVRIGSPLGSFENVFEAGGFREKPNLKQAGQLLAEGNYLWNSGIFVWTTSFILDAFEKHLPSLRRGLEALRPSIGTPEQKDGIDEYFAAAQDISIDYGLMEKAESVAVVQASFDWDDIGSWLVVERLYEEDEAGNVVRGDAVNVNTHNSTVICRDGFVATLGVSDLLIVRTADATLICRKDKIGDIDALVEEIGRSEDFEKFL